MKPQEIKDLLKTISELDLKEVRIKDKDFELRVRTDKDETVTYSSQPMQMSAPAAPVMAASAPAVGASAPAAPAADGAHSEETTAEGNYIEVKSPMVGTFYRSASPDKPAFVQVGDTIASGDVVCIIEAMKLFNEIESEVSGKIVKVCIDDSSPVEYDQVLFLVEPQ